MSKYGVISGPCFPVFTPNTEKYEQEIIPYFDTFHAVYSSMENLEKNWGRIRTIYPKSHENFKNSKPRVQFYWFLYKKECIATQCLNDVL